MASRGGKSTSSEDISEMSENLEKQNDSGIIIKTLMESFQESQNSLIEKMFDRFEASQRDLVNSLYDPETRSRQSFRTSTPFRPSDSSEENHPTSTFRPTTEQTNMSRRAFAEELHVIEEYERARRQDSSRATNITHQAGNSRPDSGHLPQLKMPIYEGKEEVDVFFTPFERLAARGGWLEQEKIDRLYQCLRGPAMRYLCSLPQDVCCNYSALKGSLINRFGRREPPTTLRRKLTEIKQRSLSNEEFAEEIRRLVMRAYPGVGLDMKDQLAAEAFLKGYRNGKIAYEVLNKNPTTLNEALDLVTFLEHNYKATLGREEKTRRVSWQDVEEAEDAPVTVNRLNQNYRPSYVTVSDLDKRLKKIEEVLQRIDLQERPATDRRSRSPSRERHRSPPAEGRRSSSMDRSNSTCYTCGREGHYARECYNRSRSPSPNRGVALSSTKTFQTPSTEATTTTKSIKISHLDSDNSGIMVKIYVNNKKAMAVVDTGADATIISDQIAAESGIKIGPEAKIFKLMNAKDGSEMDAYGGVTATIHIADRCLEWPVFVAPIRDNVLLGIDFLREVDAKILARQGDLIIGDQLVTGRRTCGASTSAVVTNNDEIIPPASEKIVIGRVHAPVEGDTCVLDPDSFHSGLKVGSVLVKSKTQIPVRIMNLEDKEICLRKDTRLGKLTSVECELKMDRQNDGSSTTQGETGVPCHLQSLYQSAKEGLSLQQEQLLADLLKRFQNVFAKDDFDLGCFKSVAHKINTGKEAPIRQPARRTPVAFQSEEDEHLDKMINSGVVVPSNSEWASPVVLVRKKDGGVRWCVDYRKLNDKTTKDAYPLPKIEECLDTLSGSSIFSTLDLMSGYYQVALDEEDQSKTAFIVKRGLYEYTRMPFGLCNAPSTFQRAMELVLRGLQWDIVLIYLDDIIVTGRTFEEHIRRLSEVLQRFEDYGLKLKPSKCNLFQKRVLFLGHVVSEHGIETNPELVKEVVSWPEPKNKKDLQSFLGLTNYYRKFIKDYSKIASPLYGLQKKDADFVWGTDQQKAFDNLKTCLMSPCILSYPQENGTFILDTDASNSSVGAVLSQEQNGQEKVIAFASKSLGPSQRRYCVTRKELLAIVVFTNQFKHYLLGRSFIIRTDHGSLAWLFRFKQPHGQLARWLEELSQYAFVIQHRAGIAHGNADGMSRRAPAENECDCYQAGRELSSLPCGGCRHCSKIHNSWEQFEANVDYVMPVAIRAVCSKRQCDDHQSDVPECNWLGVHTPEEISKAQEEDEDLGKVYEWVRHDSAPSQNEVKSAGRTLRHYWLVFDHFVIVNGVLHYKWEDQGRSTLKLLVPSNFRREVIESCHNPPLSGHQGVERTVERARKSFYWYGLREDIRHFVEHCNKCGSEKKDCATPKAPMQSYICGAPLDRIQLDVLGPLPESTRGNKYVLVIIDQFSKWVEAYPLPHQGSELIAEMLVKEFISRFGVPLELHTDQGSNFQSELFRNVCKFLQIAQTRTTPFHPASNGQVERFNRTLLQMIRCYLEEGQNHWDDQLPLLLAAYRSTPHSATKFTPNRLMLGREVYQPQDVVFKQPETLRHTSNPSVYLEELEKNMENAQSMARKHLKIAQEHQKKLHDINVLEHPYHIGDLVYVLNTARKKGKSPKLQSVRTGPYVVTKVYGPVVYEVRNNRCTKTLHHNKLKPYIAEFVPTWVNRVVEDVMSKANHALEEERTFEVSTSIQEVPDQEPTLSEGSLRILSDESNTEDRHDATQGESSLRILSEGSPDGEDIESDLVEDHISEENHVAPDDESQSIKPSRSSLRIPTKDREERQRHTRSGRQIKPRTLLDL